MRKNEPAGKASYHFIIKEFIDYDYDFEELSNFCHIAFIPADNEFTKQLESCQLSEAQKTKLKDFREDVVFNLTNLKNLAKTVNNRFYNSNNTITPAKIQQDIVEIYSKETLEFAEGHNETIVGTLTSPFIAHKQLAARQNTNKNNTILAICAAALCIKYMYRDDKLLTISQEWSTIAALAFASIILAKDIFSQLESKHTITQLHDLERQSPSPQAMASILNPKLVHLVHIPPELKELKQEYADILPDTLPGTITDIKIMGDTITVSTLRTQKCIDVTITGKTLADGRDEASIAEHTQITKDTYTAAYSIAKLKQSKQEKNASTNNAEDFRERPHVQNLIRSTSTQNAEIGM